MTTFIVEYWNHPAGKGETLFSGEIHLMEFFLEYESETMLSDFMKSRADMCKWYVKQTTKEELEQGIYWNLESSDNESGAYYYISSVKDGRRTLDFADCEGGYEYLIEAAYNEFKGR